MAVFRQKSVLAACLPVVVFGIGLTVQSACFEYAWLTHMGYLDKVLHFAAFALLGILILRLVRRLAGRRWRMALVAVVSMAAAALLGIADEAHQYFVPFRHADWLDVAANAAGAVFGVILYLCLTQAQQCR